MDLSSNKHWTIINTNTLLKWITIGSYYIKVLEENIAVNRAIIRINTIQSIILTTATGSIGVSQISSIFSPQVQMSLTLIFTVLSFFLTISTGVIKVMLIHENLEKCIQVKQEWTSFITNISTELQLPKEERQDAVKLIRDNKMVYLSLLNKDIELNYRSEAHAKKHIGEEIRISQLELTSDKANNALKKKGINNDIIEFEFSKKKALHEDYSRMMNSVGISISDITNHIVKTELQAIVELDLEAQRKQVHIKSSQLDRVKLNCEIQYKHKELEQKKHSKPTDVFLLTNTGDVGSTFSNKHDDRMDEESVDSANDSKISNTAPPNDPLNPNPAWKNMFGF